ncbi:DUF2887 domain-containing protein [Scytonema sp. NUACC26]|uniref:DUF2887 domain-containing protein n=1 Tax=Scytonema sp. NUACC26 TaxID=3140176 RepID=UPI0038B27DCA
MGKSLAQKLINQVREELIDETTRDQVLTFIQNILVYKFPNLTPEEIAAMLNLSDDIEETTYYQSVLKKTKLKGNRSGG